MDNVQNVDTYINIPSSQTYKSYLQPIINYTTLDRKPVFMLSCSFPK
jgi:hypothetical protein